MRLLRCVFIESLIIIALLGGAWATPCFSEPVIGSLLKSFNQSFITRSGPNHKNTWTGENTDVLFVEAFPYFIFKSSSWVNELFNKAELIARNGGTVCITGQSWFFAKTLAKRAGVKLSFYGEGELPNLFPTAVRLYLGEELKKATGETSVQAVFNPDTDAPVINPDQTNGMRTLATCQIVMHSNQSTEVRTYPMIVEFDLGKGKVIYSSFNLDPNLSSSSHDGIKKVIRALVAEPLKYARERQAARNQLVELK